MNDIYILLILLTVLSGCTTERLASKEAVRFNNAGVSLEGELSIPGGKAQYPLAIFIHGSGRATRNDYAEFISPFDSVGIATFRYDKRGVGASGGQYSDVGAYNSEVVFPQLASDAAAAIRHLQKDKRISGDKIIVIGGSQAGWIITELNSIFDPWLSICISGPAVTVGEEIFYSDLIEKEGYSQAEADSIFQTFTGPNGYDPVNKIAKMISPSLWIFGGKDISIPVKRSMHLLDSIAKERKLPVEIKLYPEADHGLFNSSAKMREAYVGAVVAWINGKL